MNVIVNYWAVLVAGVSSIVVGGLWYGPLFGKTWMRLTGIRADMASPEKRALARRGYIVSFLASLLTAYVLAHFVAYAGYYSGTSGVGVGAQAAFWLWLGFFVPAGLSPVLWEQRPFTLYLIGIGHSLIMLVAMGLILGGWQ